MLCVPQNDSDWPLGGRWQISARRSRWLVSFLASLALLLPSFVCGLLPTMVEVGVCLPGARGTRAGASLFLRLVAVVGHFACARYTNVRSRPPRPVCNILMSREGSYVLSESSGCVGTKRVQVRRRLAKRRQGPPSLVSRRGARGTCLGRVELRVGLRGRLPRGRPQGDAFARISAEVPSVNAPFGTRAYKALFGAPTTARPGSAGPGAGGRHHGRRQTVTGFVAASPADGPKEEEGGDAMDPSGGLRLAPSALDGAVLEKRGGAELVDNRLATFPRAAGQRYPTGPRPAARTERRRRGKGLWPRAGARAGRAALPSGRALGPGVPWLSPPTWARGGYPLPTPDTLFAIVVAAGCSRSRRCLLPRGFGDSFAKQKECVCSNDLTDSHGFAQCEKSDITMGWAAPLVIRPVFPRSRVRCPPSAPKLAARRAELCQNLPLRSREPSLN